MRHSHSKQDKEERSMLASHIDSLQGADATAAGSSAAVAAADSPRKPTIAHDDDDDADPNTVTGANRAALRRQRMYKPKSWLTRGLTAMMQLPNQTPLAVLRWTTPKGPAPCILSLPSRDAGREIKLYVWIPPRDLESCVLGNVHKHKKEGRATSPDFTPSFTGAQRPCVIDFHGGGFVMGGPLEQAPWCAALARTGIVAISVHYRLGPTWEFPASLLDAEDTVGAVLDGEGRSEAGRYLHTQLKKHSEGRVAIDQRRVGLSGFSSGGNIALNMLLSIPSHLNFARAGHDDDDDEEEQPSTPPNEHDGDWPSPFSSAASPPPTTIPTLLFFPSLDARQAPFERARPEGMAPPGEVSKWVGKTLLNAYLPRELVGHLRASPGLAPVGMQGGMQAEIGVRKRAAQEHGVAEATDEAVLSGGARLMRISSSAGSSIRSTRSSAAGRHATLDCMHPNARALLILPSVDTLSEQSEVWAEALDAAQKLSVSDEQDGSRIGVPLDDGGEQGRRTGGRVRVHRIHGMGHGFTTYPDSFIDDKTRAAKKLVMEQARQYLINMWNGQQGGVGAREGK